MLNVGKCAVMQCSFSKSCPPVPTVRADGQVVPIVSSLTLLGVTLMPTLKWDLHIDSLVSKANSRRYFLAVLRRAGVALEDLVLFYTTYIRPVLEYASPAWHPGLSTKLSDKLESAQRLCLRSILPHQSYREALVSTGLALLSARREEICLTFARSSYRSFRDWFPESRHLSGYDLRHPRILISEPQRTSCFRKSPIIFMTSLLNVHGT